MIVALILLQAAAAAPIQPLPDGSRIVVFCDPVRYRFSVRALDDGDASTDASYPQRTVIDADALMAGLPGYTNEISVRGPLIRYVRCGPYKVKLTGDAYNVYTQGESGAYPSFSSVRIIRDRRTIYPWAGDGPVRFTACDRSLPRARPCPAGYAIRVDGAYSARRKRIDLTEWTASYDELDVNNARRETRRSYSSEDDLDLWRRD